MTIDEFLAALRAKASAQRWTLCRISAYRPWDGIRTDDERIARQCPITFLGEAPCLYQSYTAGQRLGLSRADIRKIVSAADEEPAHDPVLRQALLAAVGLVDEAIL